MGEWALMLGGAKNSARCWFCFFLQCSRAGFEPFRAGGSGWWSVRTHTLVLCGSPGRNSIHGAAQNRRGKSKGERHVLGAPSSSPHRSSPHRFSPHLFFVPPVFRPTDRGLVTPRSSHFRSRAETRTSRSSSLTSLLVPAGATAGCCLLAAPGWNRALYLPLRVRCFCRSPSGSPR